MPINDSNAVWVIGPDAEGKFIEVQPGGKYDQPSAPRTVTDDENDAANAQAAKDAATDEPAPGKPAKPAKQTPAPEGDPA